MRSGARMARTRLLILLPMTLGVVSCAGAPVIVASPSACSTLLPSEWLKGVPPAPLPEGRTVGDYMVFGDAQTAQLEKANDRYGAAVGIVSRCEARDAAAVKRARPKVLGLF
jgi:hypothetical protein